LGIRKKTAYVPAKFFNGTYGGLLTGFSSDADVWIPDVILGYWRSACNRVNSLRGWRLSVMGIKWRRPWRSLPCWGWALVLRRVTIVDACLQKDYYYCDDRQTRQASRQPSREEERLSFIFTFPVCSIRRSGRQGRLIDDVVAIVGSSW